MPRHTGCLTLLIAVVTPCCAQTNRYSWLKRDAPERTIASAIGVPEGFRRTGTAAGSFADWLRYLPLKAPDAPVLLYNGQRKTNQKAHYAVLDIDTGTKNLQQCADAVVRLRAEYLFSHGLHEAIHFNFTSGHRASYTKWATGFRPAVKGERVTWMKKEAEDWSYAGFRAYLDTVFTYAGTLSLSREMQPRPRASRIESGDVFIHGGSPGHAVLVVDMAEHTRTGEKIFLLAQGYMPAQDVHVLKNPADTKISPWYKIPSGPILQTPEWAFEKTELRFFAPAPGGDGQARRNAPSGCINRALALPAPVAATWGRVARLQLGSAIGQDIYCEALFWRERFHEARDDSTKDDASRGVTGRRYLWLPDREPAGCAAFHVLRDAGIGT